MNDRKEVIIDVGSQEIVRVVDDKHIEIRHRWYPIYPYGNHVDHVIVLDREKKMLSYYSVRMDWNGTGRDDHGYVLLSDNELEKVEKEMMNIKTLDDFDKLVELFNELKKTRENKIDGIVEKLVDSAIELISADQALRTLKEIDREKLKEILLEYAYT